MIFSASIYINKKPSAIRLKKRNHDLFSPACLCGTTFGSRNAIIISFKTIHRYQHRETQCTNKQVSSRGCLLYTETRSAFPPGERPGHTGRLSHLRYSPSCRFPSFTWMKKCSHVAPRLPTIPRLYKSLPEEDSRDEHLHTHLHHVQPVSSHVGSGRGAKEPRAKSQAGKYASEPRVAHYGTTLLRLAQHRLGLPCLLIVN